MKTRPGLSQRAHRPAGRPAELAARERLPGRLGGPDPGRAPARRQAARARRADLRRLRPQRPAAHPLLAGGAGAGGHVDDTPADRKVDFGGNMQPRDRFLDWNDVREISRSGLVEIAAHTDASHYGALANPRAIPSRPPPCASTTRAMAATRTRPASSNAWAATWPRSAKRSAAPPARRRAGSGPMAPRAAPRCASPANRVIRWR